MSCFSSILWCQPRLAYLQDINSSGEFEIKLTITNYQEIAKFAQFVDVIQYSFTRQFSYYQIILRTVFLIISIVALGFYSIHFWRN